VAVEQFLVSLKKEAHKFSATHFTVFGAGNAERLHGHNYSVGVECGISKLDELGMAFEFNSLKRHIKKTADAWDEFVLIPKLNPYLKISSENIAKTPHTVVNFENRSYRFPHSEVIQLDVTNITSEELAKSFLENLIHSWLSSLEESERSILIDRLAWVEVSIEETAGQKAAYRKVFTQNPNGGLSR
jgi:6-pyruvoyltetrahydropterin/6-carboxytetrahydropterin synthase